MIHANETNKSRNEVGSPKVFPKKCCMLNLLSFLGILFFETSKFQLNKKFLCVILIILNFRIKYIPLIHQKKQN